MLLRTIIVFCTLFVTQAHALELQDAGSLRNERSDLIAPAASTANTNPTIHRAPDESPVGGYGLAIAALALVGFMSRH